MQDISERIRLLAAELPRGWQADLARHCGVKPPSVNGWVQGNTKRMEAEHLFNTADFFKVNPRWLAFGIGPRDIDDSSHEAAKEAPPLPPATLSIEAVLHALGAALAQHNRQTREMAAVMLRNFARDPQIGANILRALVMLLTHPDPPHPDGDRPSWGVKPPEPPPKPEGAAGSPGTS